MKATFRQHDNAAAVATQLGCADVDAALSLLDDAAALEEGLRALGWARADDYAVVRVAPVLSRFVRRRAAGIRAFLGGDAPLREVYRGLIDFLDDDGFHLDPERLYETLRPSERASHACLMAELRRQDARDVVHFLGFGLAQGDYERELADCLVAEGFAGEVRLYGCDPYVDFSGTGIEAWEPPAADALADVRRFDVILARWVLHHLEPAFRWQSFIPVGRHLAPGGLLLIQEEGDFRDAGEQRFVDRLRDLLLAAMDVINTRTFVAEWHEKAAESADAYYLQHLSAADVAAIEAGLGYPFERRVIETEPGIFGQTILSYRRPEAGTLPATTPCGWKSCEP